MGPARTEAACVLMRHHKASQQCTARGDEPGQDGRGVWSGVTGGHGPVSGFSLLAREISPTWPYKVQIQDQLPITECCTWATMSKPIANQVPGKSKPNNTRSNPANSPCMQRAPTKPRMGIGKSAKPPNTPGKNAWSSESARKAHELRATSFAAHA